MCRTLALQLFGLLLKFIVSESLDMDNHINNDTHFLNSKKKNTLPIFGERYQLNETHSNRHRVSPSDMKIFYEDLYYKSQLPKPESQQIVKLIYWFISQLQWRTVTVIYDWEEESSVTFLSDMLTSVGMTVLLYTHTDNMSEVFSTLVAEQTILILCSTSCTVDVIEQGSLFAIAFQKASLMRHTTKWVLVNRQRNITDFSHHPNVTTPTFHCVGNLTHYSGVLDNIAVIIVPLTSDDDIHFEKSFEVYTSMWGKNGRYWKEILSLPASTSLNSIVFPNSKTGYNGRQFMVGTIQWPPFIIRDDDSTYSGFAVDILNILRDRLNFTYEFVEPEDRNYGIEVNGSWSGLIGQLLKGEVDMVITDIIITHEREVVVDFTCPFLMDTATIAVRRSMDRQGRVWTYTHPLKLEVYLCIVSSFVVVLLTVAAMDVFHRSNSTVREPLSRDRTVPFWYLIGVPFRQGNEEMFRRIPGRPVVGSWWILTFLVTAVYTGNLIAFLTFNNDAPPFNTALQMATETNFKWGCVRGASYLNLFESSNLTVHKLLLEGIRKFNQSDPDILSPDPDVHFQKLLTEDYAYIGGRPVVSYWMRQCCQLRTLKDSFFPVKYSMAFPQGSPYKDVFSEMILQLVNSGVMDRLQQRWWPENTCSQGEKTKSQSVTLADAQAAFYSALSGVAIATFVLITERCWRR